MDRIDRAQGGISGKTVYYILQGPSWLVTHTSPQRGITAESYY